LWDIPAFKISIYHKLKVSYIIRLVIIKHVLVKELLILKVQNDDIKPDKNICKPGIWILDLYFFDIKIQSKY
jgi:hypothetical protein